MIHYDDIPHFTRQGRYNVTVPLKYIESQLAGWAKSDNVDMDPDFQRAHVWSEEQQSRFVEYVLRGGVSSREIFWNCPFFDSNRAPGKLTFYLVDGKQRLEACRKFIRGELKVLGHYFEDFDNSVFRVSTALSFTVNDLETRAEMLQWYLDLNSGGVLHTEEELRRVRALLDEELFLRKGAVC